MRPGGHSDQGGEIAPPRPWSSEMQTRARRSDVGDAGGVRSDRRRWGSRWRWRLLLLAAREATAGKYCGRPVRLVRRRGRRLGRHDRRRQVPPRRLLRHAARSRPLRRRSPEELHPGRQATVSGTRFARWRWEAPPGTGITPGQRHLVARAPRRHGAAARAPASWDGGFEPFAAATGTDTTPARLRRRLLVRRSWRFEDRLLCARAESKWCDSTPTRGRRLRALTITLDDDYAAGLPVDRRRDARRRLAARRPRARLLGRRRRRRRPLQRDRRRRRPCRPHRVPLRQGARSAASGGGPGCSPAARAQRRGTARDDRASATARTASATAPPISPATSAALPERRSGSTTTLRPTPAASTLAGGEGWRRVERLRLLLEQPGPGPCQPDLRGLLADHRPGGYDSG